MYIRTCQECGFKQESKNPKDYKNEKWRQVMCKKCKSTALDYGSEVSIDLDQSDDRFDDWEDDD